MSFKEIESKIKSFGKNHPTYWGCALCGEAGELANILKKMERNHYYEFQYNEQGQGYSVREDSNRGTRLSELKRLAGEELADVFIYIVLTARFLGIELEKEINRKIKIIEFRELESDKS